MPKKIVDINVSPYYDSSQKELDKGYVKLLTKEGQVLQNRELNIAQGLIYGNLRKVTDVILDDGAVISGCNFINNETNKICTLYAGEIYVNGVIVKIPETSWPYKINDDDEESSISLTTNTVIYAEIFSNVYDERDDKSLYDPAEHMENYGNTGGHRLKYEATIGAVKESLYNEKTSQSSFLRIKLYILKALLDNSGESTGSLTVTALNTQPIYGKIQAQMEQRTYDQSGDFIAEGMQVAINENKDNPLYKYNIVISRGRAYVKGASYSYNNTTIITDAATDIKSNGNIGENKTFNSSNLKYYLNNTSVSTVYSLTGTLKQLQLAMVYATTRVNQISTRYNVSEVVKIYDASNNIYIKDTDYIVQGNTISWKITGNHPTGTFYVDFLYTGSLSYGIDYSIGNDNTGYYIEFLSGGIWPADGKEFNIKYSWYLSRVDLLYIREDGVISVKKGIPGYATEISEPTIPVGALPLAMIYVKPTQTPRNYTINNYNIYRVPVAQLQNMKQRISDLEQNVALTKLETEAQSKYIEQDSLTNLRNVYVDSVVDFTKADLGNIEYNATLDFFDREIRLPQNTNQLSSSDLTYTVYSSNNTISNNFGNGILHMDIVSKPVVDSQLLATGNRDITPFYYKGLKPTLSCNPSKLIYVEDQGQTSIIWLPTRVIYSSATVENWIRNQTTTNGYWLGQKFTRTITNNERERLITYYKSYSIGSHIIDSTSTTSTAYSEEIVNQTETVDLIPSAYIKAGSIITLTGRDWPVNTEIALYLDDSVITPEYTDVTINNATEFVMPTNDNLISFNNIVDTVVNKPVIRPNIWRWHNVKLNDSAHVWKLTHPFFNNNNTTDGISFYYDLASNVWYYTRENNQNNINNLSDLTVLNKAPVWARFLTRSPWINKYIITDISSQEQRDVIENINITENVTKALYTNEFNSTKTTVVTDSNGCFNCNIAIPSGTITGKHVIKAETVLPKDFDPDYYFNAETQFSGEAYIRRTSTYLYKRKVETITTTVYNDMLEIVKNINNDPVAQTFSLSDSQYLSGLDIYFNTLPYTYSTTTDADRAVYNFTVTVRETENGYPSSKILYQKTINGADKDISGNYIIKVSNNLASDGYYSPTHIEFDYPIFVEGNKLYAFTVGSNRDGFHILYAQMGNTNILDNTPITLQPSTTGTMFLSGDGNAWSPDQESDLTYKLYGTVFSTTDKEYYLTDIKYDTEGSITNYFGMMNFSVDTTVFEDTDIAIKYAINVDNLRSYTNWLPLTLEQKYIFEPLDTYKTNGMNLSIKFKLSSINNKLTPMINLNTLELYLAKYKSVGAYIMNSIAIQ